MDRKKNIKVKKVNSLHDLVLLLKRNFGRSSHPRSLQLRLPVVILRQPQLPVVVPSPDPRSPSLSLAAGVVNAGGHIQDVQRPERTDLAGLPHVALGILTVVNVEPESPELALSPRVQPAFAAQSITWRGSEGGGRRKEKRREEKKRDGETDTVRESLEEWGRRRRRRRRRRELFVATSR